MANNNEKTLLDLSTDKYIGHINIDGNSYGLLHGENLSLLQQSKLQGLGTKLAKISVNVKDEKTEAEYSKIMTHILELIMPAAETKLINKLSVIKKYQAIDAYNTKVESLKKKTNQLTKGPRATKKKR
jgi:hypothetical protein